MRSKANESHSKIESSRFLTVDAQLGKESGPAGGIHLWQVPSALSGGARWPSSQGALEIFQV